VNRELEAPTTVFSKVAGASSSKADSEKREQDAPTTVSGKRVAGASSSRAHQGKREQDAPTTVYALTKTEPAHSANSPLR